MEVDSNYEAGPSTSLGGTVSDRYPLPQIDEIACERSKTMTAKDQLVAFLDNIESQVEKMRKDAARLEEEKDHLLSSLDTIRQSDNMHALTEFEKDDIQRYADRVTARCLTVDISVRTTRDRTQEDALFQVNHFIDSLVIGLRSDVDGTKSRCIAYMNACSEHLVQGITDKNFETALLGCTLDDQKRIKKRLYGLLNYIDEMDRLM